MLLRSVVFEIFLGGTELTFFKKNMFENILSLTGVAAFCRSYQYIPNLPFELLKLDLCANAVIGRM